MMHFMYVLVNVPSSRFTDLTVIHLHTVDDWQSVKPSIDCQRYSLWNDTNAKGRNSQNNCPRGKNVFHGMQGGRFFYYKNLKNTSWVALGNHTGKKTTPFQRALRHWLAGQMG